MADFNPPLTVRNCGNPEHGPKWACHRVTDATGRILLLSVDRETAETFASVASLREQVRDLKAKRKEDAEAYLADLNEANAGKTGLREQVRDLQKMLERSRANEREHLDTINRLTSDGVEAREQVRTLTAERDEARESAKDWERTTFAAGQERHAEWQRHLETQAERDALRDRVAELEEDKAHWDECDAALRANADHLRGVIVTRTEERDAAQQRANALEKAVRRVTRDALETLAKMPTPTKAHEELAALQRNLFLRVREEIDAAMAAATTKEEAP